MTQPSKLVQAQTVDNLSPQKALKSSNITIFGSRLLMLYGDMLI